MQAPAIWELVRRQHGVVSRAQLLELGIGREGIRRRVASGRLHRVRRGIYAVGRPQITRRGGWTAALLACGPGAALSHGSAAAMLGVGSERGVIEVAVRSDRAPRPAGIRVHRRRRLAADVVERDGIACIAVAATLIDLATYLGARALDRAVNEADRLDLIDPEALRRELDRRPGRGGVARLRSLLDRDTFRLTDSELERRFLTIARDAGLPTPLTGARLNGFKVDFFWPELGLVVETDGLRYHRTAAAQARDRRRDHAHAAAGLTPVRFTHAQIAHERRAVVGVLVAVARRITSVR